jgi:hypothetical protein
MIITSSDVGRYFNLFFYGRYTVFLFHILVFALVLLMMDPCFISMTERIVTFIVIFIRKTGTDVQTVIHILVSDLFLVMNLAQPVEMKSAMDILVRKTMIDQC